MLGRTLSLQDLHKLKSSQTVVMSSHSGLSNQLRTILGIQLLGHHPVVRYDKRFVRKLQTTEKIRIVDLFQNLEEIPPRLSLTPEYRSWVLPLPPDQVQIAALFNALNFVGVINPVRLPGFREETQVYRNLFHGLGPVIDRDELPVDGTDGVGLHLRVFGAFSQSLFNVEKTTRQGISRHYCRISWHDQRFTDFRSIMSRLVDKGEKVTIFSDKHDSDGMRRALDILTDLGLNPIPYRSTRPHGFEALEDLLALSKFRRIIGTEGSTFSHLGALLSDDLEMAAAV